MVTTNELMGGITTSPNRAPFAKVLASALSNNRASASLISALGAYNIPLLVVATVGSETTNFGALAVGDQVIHIDTTGAGSNSLLTVVAAGTLPSAAIVGDIYVAFRPQNLDGNNPIIPAGAQLTGRETGNGGIEF